MRVLFNGTSTIRAKSGVGHTTTHLHRALSVLARKDDFWLYPGNTLRRLASHYLRIPVQQTGTITPPKPSANGLFKRLALQIAQLGYAAHFHAIARLGRFDLYHEPNLVPFGVQLPTVVTVHDLSVVLFPEWHPIERVRRYEKAFARGVERAAHILVDSDSVRSEAIGILGLNPQRVTTIHMGIGSNFHIQTESQLVEMRTRLDLPARYLLYVGTVEPRKNLTTLLRAYCDLPTELRERCPLILGGRWGWKSEPVRELFESEARHRNVRYLGYVADEDLPALYGGAIALLYPSFYEGFGLPPIEAMACGTAAIVSTADAVREVVGKQAILIDANDSTGWRKAMQRAIEDRDYLENYRQSGIAHAARFSWDRAAKTTLEVYREVLGLVKNTNRQVNSSRAA
jgi:glycosyltransferase involved in cell wall biosynthesis